MREKWKTADRNGIRGAATAFEFLINLRGFLIPADVALLFGSGLVRNLMPVHNGSADLSCIILSGFIGSAFFAVVSLYRAIQNW